MTALARPSKDQLVEAGAVRVVSMTPAPRPLCEIEEYRNTVRLIWTLKRRSWEYLREAEKAEKHGYPGYAAVQRRQADRKRASAWWYLRHLRGRGF